MSYTAIVDYGVGNLKSVTNAMRYLGCGRVSRRGGTPARTGPGPGTGPSGGEKAHFGHLSGHAAFVRRGGRGTGMQRPWSGPWKRPADQDGPKAPPYRLEQPEPPESLSAVPGTGSSGNQRRISGTDASIYYICNANDGYDIRWLFQSSAKRD